MLKPQFAKGSRMEDWNDATSVITGRENVKRKMYKHTKINDKITFGRRKKALMRSQTLKAQICISC